MACVENALFAYHFRKDLMVLMPGSQYAIPVLLTVLFVNITVNVFMYVKRVYVDSPVTISIAQKTVLGIKNNGTCRVFYYCFMVSSIFVSLEIGFVTSTPINKAVVEKQASPIACLSVGSSPTLRSSLLGEGVCIVCVTYSILIIMVCIINQINLYMNFQLLQHHGNFRREAMPLSTHLRTGT